MGVYDTNETMRIIGRQNLDKIGDSTKIIANINEIAKARPLSGTLDFALDCYIIGYINGKREERKRKRN